MEMNSRTYGTTNSRQRNHSLGCPMTIFDLINLVSFLNSDNEQVVCRVFVLLSVVLSPAMLKLKRGAYVEYS